MDVNPIADIRLRALGPQLDRSIGPDLAVEQQRIALQAHEVYELTIDPEIERDLGHSLGH